MVLFGILFFVVGLISMFTCIGFGLSESNFMLICMGMLFGLSFCSCGLAVAIPAAKAKANKKKALQMGKKYLGIIIGYEDDTSFYVNGVPGLIAIARCDIDGNKVDIAYNTHQTSESDYPLGAFCDVYVYDKIAYIDEKSCVKNAGSQAEYTKIMEEMQKQVGIPTPVQAQYSGISDPLVQQSMAFQANQMGQMGQMNQTGQYSANPTPEYDGQDNGVRYLNGKPVDRYGNPL